MKKLISLLLFSICALCGYAQLFTKITHYDKFDDIVKEETRKTLITKTDSTFVIEEKGRQPVVYYILKISEAGTRGSKDDIVNLIEDVYGYQTCWLVVRYDILDKYREALHKFAFNPSEESAKILSSFWLFATNRIITTQYSGTYIKEFFWIEDESNNNKLGKDVNRIIYSK